MLCHRLYTFYTHSRHCSLVLPQLRAHTHCTARHCSANEHTRMQT